MKRLTWVKIVAIASLVFLLAACSGSQSGGEPTAAVSSSDSPSSMPSPTTTAPTSTEKEVLDSLCSKYCLGLSTVYNLDVCNDGRTCQGQVERASAAIASVRSDMKTNNIDPTDVADLDDALSDAEEAIASYDTPGCAGAAAQSTQMFSCAIDALTIKNDVGIVVYALGGDPSAGAPPSTVMSAPPAVTTAPTTTASPAYEPIPVKNYTGSGDDVITIEKPTDTPALLEFSCPACDSNVAVKTDNDLLVNDIGSYTGTHLIDVRAGENTTTVEITADSDWTLDVTDITTAPDVPTGSGDSVIWVRTGTKAAVTHDGTSNFSIVAVSAEGRDLLINEIGPYSGTVAIDTPSILDITADGNWSLTVS